MEATRADTGRITWLYGIIAIFMFVRGVLGVHNETVDDTSDRIFYTGTWLACLNRSVPQSTVVPDRVGGTTHYTKVQGSYATFHFRGVSAIYFVGYSLTAENIDGGTVMDVELDGTLYRVNQRREERRRALVWSSGAIDPTRNHTLVCRKTSRDGSGFDVNIDAFVVTVPDAEDVPNASQATNTFSSDDGAASTTSQSVTRLQTGLSPTSSSAGPTPILPGANSGLLDPTIIWLPSGIAGSSATSQASGVSSVSPLTGMSTATIAGCTVGAVFLLTCIALFFYLLGRRPRQRAIPAIESLSDQIKGGSDVLGYPRPSIDGASYNDVDSATLPTPPSPVRREKGRRGRGTRLDALRVSDNPVRSDIEFDDDDVGTSIASWVTAPPAYDQPVSSRPLPGVPLSNVRE